LRLLGDVCERLPPGNDTDYGREAKALLGTPDSEGFGMESNKDLK
jgi:hypothetical protein